MYTKGPLPAIEFKRRVKEVYDTQQDRNGFSAVKIDLKIFLKHR